MVIYGSSYEELEEIQTNVLRSLRKNRNMFRIESDYTKNKPEVKLITNVFSCGSGVTASVLALAYSLINAKYMPTIYDGSWAEYGKN